MTRFADVYDPVAGTAKGVLAEMVVIVVLVYGDRVAALELHRGLVEGEPAFFPTRAIPKEWAARERCQEPLPADRA